MTTSPTSGWMLRGLRDLRIASEAVTERVARAAGLNPRDLGVLDVLHADGPATPKQLTARTGIHPATLTAALARLERDGHVVRESDPADRRSVRIAVTDSTVRMLTEQYETVNGQLDTWFGQMTTSEQHQIGSFLHAAAARIAGTEQENS